MAFWIVALIALLLTSLLRRKAGRRFVNSQAGLLL